MGKQTEEVDKLAQGQDWFNLINSPEDVDSLVVDVTANDQPSSVVETFVFSSNGVLQKKR